MNGATGEVAVLRGSHSDVIETPGLKGRIEIDATDADPTVRVPEHVGIAYGGSDELQTDGGTVNAETRIRQIGWSPAHLSRERPASGFSGVHVHGREAGVGLGYGGTVPTDQHQRTSPCQL